jgi:hypothetical protein
LHNQYLSRAPLVHLVNNTGHVMKEGYLIGGSGADGRVLRAATVGTVKAAAE